MKKVSYLQRKENLVESLCLPKDICLGDIKVTLLGCHEASIENYKGILEYNDCMILLQGKTCQVLFEGNRLKIDYYTSEDMRISGVISAIKYIS